MTDAPATSPAPPIDPRPPVRRPALWLALLVAYGLALSLPFLGSGPLADHEALAAERTRELMQRGHWLIPYLNGQADLRKYPLECWVSGGFSLLTGGVDEWTARLPAALSVVGVMLLLVWWLCANCGWRPALVGGFVWLTSTAGLFYSRRAEVEMQLCLWTTATLVCYWFALTDHRGTRTGEFRGILPLVFSMSGYALAMWFCLALGLYAKGPMTPGMLGITGLVMLLGAAEGRRLARLAPVLGPLVLVALVAPWLWYVYRTHPAAMATIYDESIGRFFAGKTADTKPFYMTIHQYFYQAPLLWLPWLLFVVLGVYWSAQHKLLTRPQRLYLLAWGLGGLAILSLSAGKRVHYALVTVPPAIIFAAVALDHFLFNLGRLSGPGRWLALAHALAVPGAIAGTIIAAIMLPDYRADIILLGAAATAGLALVTWLMARQRRLAALVAFGALLLVLQLVAWGRLIPETTAPWQAQAVGRFVGAHAAAGDAVCCFTESQPDAVVLFYAGRPLEIVPVDLRNPDAGLARLAAWRAAHPGGYVVVARSKYRAVLDGLPPPNAWTPVELPPTLPTRSPDAFDVLRVPAAQ